MHDFREHSDIPLYETELSFPSKGLVDYFSYSKQKKFVAEELLQFNDSDPTLRRLFTNEDTFVNSSDDGNEYLQTGTVSFLQYVCTLCH